MSDNTFMAAVDAFKVKLERLEEAWLDLQRCDSLDNVYPLVDGVWNEYSAARIDAENAITDLVQELGGFYVLAQISNVHVEECE